MGYEESALWALIEDSEDLHSDSMKNAQRALDDLVEIERDRPKDPGRRRFFALSAKGGAAVAAGAIVGPMLGGVAAFAQSSGSSVNVQALQTSASLENLAVFTYGKALTLPFIANGNAVVKAFAQKTMAQHSEHAGAFNAAAQKLGGKAQTNPNPVLTPQIQQMVPGLTDPSKVVALAATLERTASETYSKNCQLMDDPASRQVMSSVLGVDSQHLAVLLAVQALLAGNATQLIAIPTNVAALPAAAGSIGFPDAFLPNAAPYTRPPAEGAVQ